MPNYELNCVAPVGWANLPTPLEKLYNFDNVFNAVTIFMKRDDLTGHCFGGNKERQLEYIMADALNKKATVIVTVGTLQSNHCRMTTAFANKLGMKTELILIKNQKGESFDKDGNYFLNKLMGAKIHLAKVNEVQKTIDDILDLLVKKNECPYFIEGGGHNIFGALGYLFAMKELKKQSKEMGISLDYLVLPVGTGTTQAGLILGKWIFGLKTNIIGISVSRKKKRCVEEIFSIINNTLKYLKLRNVDLGQYINVCDDYIGRRYGVPSEEGTNALQLLAKQEGLIVDPIYNAKAIAGMFDLISNSTLKGNVIYLNTGGLTCSSYTKQMSKMI